MGSRRAARRITVIVDESETRSVTAARRAASWDTSRSEVVDEVLARTLAVDPVQVVRFVERLEGVVRVVDLLGYDVDERLADSQMASATEHRPAAVRRW